MWKCGDVKPETSYRILLCQTGEDRYLKIADANLDVLDSDALFVTEPVPSELLLARNVYTIAQKVRLRGGGNFVVDAHNVWFTQEEATEIRKGTDFREIPWAAGKAPRLAPK